MARRSFGNLRKLPSGRWQASYADDATGQRIAALSTFGTKADAALWLSTVEADRARGHLLDQRLALRPFEEWAADWLAGLQVKPKTEVSYESSLRNHVLPVFQRRPVGSITYRDCKAGALLLVLLPGILALWPLAERRERRRLDSLPPPPSGGPAGPPASPALVSGL